MSEHEMLKSEAMRAIKAVFLDDSVLSETAIASLQEIAEEIKELLDTLPKD